MLQYNIVMLQYGIVFLLSKPFIALQHRDRHKLLRFNKKCKNDIFASSLNVPSAQAIFDQLKILSPALSRVPTFAVS